MLGHGPAVRGMRWLLARPRAQIANSRCIEGSAWELMMWASGFDLSALEDEEEQAPGTAAPGAPGLPLGGGGEAGREEEGEDAGEERRQVAAAVAGVQGAGQEEQGEAPLSSSSLAHAHAHSPDALSAHDGTRAPPAPPPPDPPPAAAPAAAAAHHALSPPAPAPAAAAPALPLPASPDPTPCHDAPLPDAAPPDAPTPLWWASDYVQLLLKVSNSRMLAAALGNGAAAAGNGARAPEAGLLQVTTSPLTLPNLARPANPCGSSAAEAPRDAAQRLSAAWLSDLNAQLSFLAPLVDMMNHAPSQRQGPSARPRLGDDGAVVCGPTDNVK